MTEDSSTLEVAGTTLASAAAQCIPFMEDNPRVWLTIIENTLSQIPKMTELSKFRILSTKLPPKLLKLCADILIIHPYEEGLYEKLKDRIISCTEGNKDKRLSELFDNLEISDRCPSEFFRYLQNKYAGLGLSNEILINRLIQKLPVEVQQTLLPWKDEFIDKFLDLADRCWDLYQKCVPAVAAAVKEPYFLRPSRSNTRLSSDSTISNRKQAFRKNGSLCYFHFVFRKQARNCCSPCAWKKTNIASTNKKFGKLQRRKATTPGVEICFTSPVKKCLFVRERNSCQIFLIDTGSEISVIPASKDLKKGATQKYSPMEVLAANDSPVQTYGIRTLSLDLGLCRNFTFDFVVADIKTALIGADFLHHYDLVPRIATGQLLDMTTQHVVDCGTANSEVAKILQKYPNFTRPQTNRPNSIKQNNVGHTIETMEPQCCRQLPPDKLKMAKEEFRKPTELDIICPSKSPCVSPSHLIKNSNGENISISANFDKSKLPSGDLTDLVQHIRSQIKKLQLTPT